MKISDEKLISALLSCSTNEQAAKMAGLSVSQLYRRMREVGFKQRYEAAKQQLFSRTLEKAQKALFDAVDTLVSVMHDQTAGQQTRINAALGLIQAATRLQKSAQTEKELCNEWEYF